mmetsp:Transcript_29710/g.63090  ORF Transcript_29710/g.63090 Transcript_29710/m.63090 type:complete len:420 (-) Transcript_29710:107-1366(-)
MRSRTTGIESVQLHPPRCPTPAPSIRHHRPDGQAPHLSRLPGGHPQRLLTGRGTILAHGLLPGLLHHPQRGVHPRQLRHHLRAVGRNHGPRPAPESGLHHTAVIHHPGGQPHGRRFQEQASRGPYQRRLLARRGHQAQEERDLPRRRREAQPPGGCQRHRPAQRDQRRRQDEVVPVGHARAQAGPERQAHVRGHGEEQPGPVRQVHRAGGHQVPPVRTPRQVRERSDHILHPARRRVRPHVLPPGHARQAPDLGRGRGGAPPRLQDRVHDQDEVPVQVQERGQQRRDLHTGPSRRGQPQLQVQRGQRDLPPRQGLRGVDHQAVPRRTRVPHEGALRPPEHQQGGRRRWREGRFRRRRRRRRHGHVVEEAHRGQVRDTLLHRVRHSGAVPQDHREERVPGAALGQVHHGQRGLPAENGLD